MTNLQLLAIASVCLAVAIWYAFARTSAAAAPVILACILFAQGLGGPVWEWAKWSSGAGLPPSVVAAPFRDSHAVPAFLWAAMGASLAALLLRPAPRQPGEGSTWQPSRTLSIAAAGAAIFTFCGFLVGQGPNFLRREVYLAGDGPTLVLRMFWPLGVLFGLIAVVLLAVERDRWIRLGLFVGALGWYVGPLSVGSRLALAVPLVSVAVLVYHEVSRRRLHVPAIAAAVFLSVLAAFTFSVILQARGMPHGLLNMPNVAEATIAKAQTSTDSFLLPVKQLASSIFASVPNAEQSAVYGVDPDVLIANANVLPGTAQPMELERYWPYQWVPLSFAGTWYGAFGGVPQLILFGAIGWVAGYAASNLQRSTYPVLSLVPLGFAAIIGVLSIQYSSRMVWRIISILIALAIVSFLIRRARPRRLTPGPRARPDADDVAQSAAPPRTPVVALGGVR